MSVIVYNRGQSRVSAETLERLAGECPDLIGFKDGTGDIDTVRRVTLRLGDGFPTSVACRHTSCLRRPTGVRNADISSAVFNFVPETALSFHKAFSAGDDATCEKLLTGFYHPFAEIRDRQAGYAVSAVKAGVRLRGFEVGSVRSPLRIDR